MQGADWEWTDPLVLGSLIVGIALLVLIEIRAITPLIEIDLFRDTGFSIYSLVASPLNSPRSPSSLSERTICNNACI